MTRVFEQDAPDGGVRILILGVGSYPNAKVARPTVPVLDDLSSATQSALDLLDRLLGPWRGRFDKPIRSIDMLANAPGSPDGLEVPDENGDPLEVEAPTIAAIVEAKKRWLKDAGPKDMLIFYACGHGFWVPSLVGRTLAASDFGEDPDNPWTAVVALDDFQLALGERAPRSQWLFFDCCANTPSEALKATSPRPNALLVTMAGERQVMIELHGPLEQVRFATSTIGAQAYGKDGRASRFMETLLEACDGSAYLIDHEDEWWIDSQTLGRSILSFGKRIAPTEEEDYFTFPQVSETDAETIPRFMRRATPSDCILLARSVPAYRLSEAHLAVTCPPDPTPLGEQPAGGDTPFRQVVAAWDHYEVTATFPEGSQTRPKRAQPPLTEVVF